MNHLNSISYEFTNNQCSNLDIASEINESIIKDQKEYNFVAMKLKKTLENIDYLYRKIQVFDDQIILVQNIRCLKLDDNTLHLMTSNNTEPRFQKKFNGIYCDINNFLCYFGEFYTCFHETK